MPADASQIVLDAQHPWPGPAAYDEAGSDYFHGRDAEADELLRLVSLSPLVALYGASGLGKSSLLQAGLFPRLRWQHYLPVLLRLDFGPKALNPSEQIARRLEAELLDQGADYPVRESDETLWRYLHRRDLAFWSRDNYPLIPLLVFDQFEEIFSQETRGRDDLRDTRFTLANLFGNLVPPDVADAADRATQARLDPRTQRYRVLIAFREDFLPDFKVWSRDLPNLLKRDLRLTPLTRANAIDCVKDAGTHVLAEPKEETAAAIVDFVGNLDKAREAAGRAIEPVLLSLCCYRLNLLRPEVGGVPQPLEEELLKTAGENILGQFYADALQGLPASVAHFVEDRLIQGERFRTSYPIEAAREQGLLTEQQLRILTDRRLVRVDRQGDVPRIELIHDRLVAVVAKARDERLRQEAAERERKELQEQQRVAEERQLAAERLLTVERQRADAERRGRRRMFAMLILALVATASALWFAFDSTHQRILADDQRTRAEAQLLWHPLSLSEREGMDVKKRDTLLMLAAADAPHKEAFLRLLRSDVNLAERFTYAAQEIIQAAVGVDPKMRAWLVRTFMPPLGRLDPSLIRARAMALVTIEARIDPNDVITAISVTRNRKKLSVLSQSLAEVAGRLEAGPAAAVAERLVQAILDTSDYHQRLALGEGLAALTGTLKDEPATALTASLVQAVLKPEGTFKLSALGEALAAVADKLGPESAAALAEGYLLAIPKAESPDRRFAVAEGLAAAAGRLDPGLAAVLADRLVEAILKANDPAYLSIVGKGLVAVASRQDPGPAAALADRLVQVIIKIDDPIPPFAPFALRDALVALTGRLDPGPAAALADRLVQATIKGETCCQPSPLGAALSAVMGRLEPGLVAAMTERFVEAILRVKGPSALSILSKGLTAVADIMEAGPATAVAKRLVQAILKAENHFQRSALGEGFAAAAGRLGPGPAAAMAETSVQAILKTKDPDQISALSTALAAAAGRLEADAAIGLADRIAQAVSRTPTGEVIRALLTVSTAFLPKISLDDRRARQWIELCKYPRAPREAVAAAVRRSYPDAPAEDNGFCAFIDWAAKRFDLDLETPIRFPPPQPGAG